MVHSYLTIPLCMDHLRLAESTLTLCVVITLIHCMVALTMQFQLMLQTVLINKWMLYYNVVEVSNINLTLLMTLSLTHTQIIPDALGTLLAFCYLVAMVEIKRAFILGLVDQIFVSVADKNIMFQFVMIL